MDNGNLVKPIILIVENDPATRALIELRLKRLGYNTMSVFDGQAALEKLYSFTPIVLILDLYLPKVSGLDVLKVARAKGLLLGSAVIIISSFGFQEVVQQAVQIGANAFIMKPVDLDILEAKIRPYLTAV